jgi:Rrf2 family protein
MLSKTSIYAIRALLFISLNGKDGFVLIREMSEKLNISFHFLTKILQKLKDNRIVKSHQGPKGGVSLAKSPGKIFLIDILKILDDDKIFKTCILGLHGCGEKTPCPVHDDWSKILNRTKKLFYNTTIQDLTLKIRKSNLRISDLKIA